MINAGDSSIYRVLRQGVWFAELPEPLQRLIVEQSEIKSYGPGQVISLEGARAVGLFALVHGRARVVRHVDNVDEVLVHVAEPGFWFGELGLLAGVPPAVTVIAAEPSRALMLSKRRFESIIDRELRYYRDFARLRSRGTRYSFAMRRSRVHFDRRNCCVTASLRWPN